MKEFRFSDPLYETEICYLIGGTVPQLISYIKRKHKNSLPYSWSKKFDWGDDADTTNGYQFHINAPLGSGEVFYVWLHEPSASLLYHETYHLTGDILHVRGIEYSESSEEAFAYLGAWIFKEIFRLLKGRL